MNLDQLQVFLAVARHLHFSRAAEELYITQPAVSASVAKLESQYGVKLFHRIGRRVELTDAGRFLLEEGPRLLDGVERLERGLQEFNDLRRGVLSLGASFTVGNYWLPSRLSRFGDLHPEIELLCTLGNADQVLEGTARGQFDLCFLTGWANREEAPELEGHLSAVQVGQERLQVVVGRSHPWFGIASISGNDLRRSAWIVRERGVKRHRKLRHFRHRKVSHPRPGLGPCFRSGSALAAPAVPLFAHGFRDWLRWLSSVLDAGGAVPAVFPSDLLGWRRWRLAADAD